MHDIEPYYNWQHLYKAEDDNLSPFFNREYSELFFSHAVYNYLIHPQWDSFGSTTLYLKILYVDYSESYAVIELIGEWNDCLHNDIMLLKRDLIDTLIEEGISKFILIGENVLNFHASDDSYYEEWFDDVEDGWIVFLNFRDHVLHEIKSARIDYYVIFGGELDEFEWRKYSPIKLFNQIENIIGHRLV
jgi:hypothetical protein